MKTVKQIVCDVYSRVSGYYQPVRQWNKGKKEEFENRLQMRISDIRKKLDEQDGNRKGL